MLQDLAFAAFLAGDAEALIYYAQNYEGPCLTFAKFKVSCKYADWVDRNRRKIETLHADINRGLV